MRKATFVRNVQYNFLKAWGAANSELSSGVSSSGVCTIASTEGLFKASRAEKHGLKPSGTQLPQTLHVVRVGSLVSQTSRASLLPPTTLCRHVESAHRKYSSASESSKDVGGVVQIELAQTGEGIADCELLQWFVQEGDEVDEFQPLCEVQSDKASVEITSRYKGKVTQVYFVPGDIVKVGETLLELVMEGGNSPAAGDSSAENELEDRSSGLSTESSSLDHAGTAIHTTPAVRQLAKRFGINLADVLGSGNNGRILKDDVLDFVVAKEELAEEIRTIETVSGTEGTVFQKLSADCHSEIKEGPEVFSKDEVTVAAKQKELGVDKIIPVRGFRRIMAKTMTAAAAVPHFHYTEEITVDAIVQLRDSLKNIPLEQGVKLTYLPFLIKALSLALQELPLMNSTVNEDISQITIRASHNIGVGMATSSGLVVPNVKNVQKLSVLDIAKELSRLTQLAGTNKLSNDDITGGTISVSNFGAIGGKYGSPVLNLPEVAIVAIGRIQKLPRYGSDGSIYPASVMGVTWAADHRVVDGATVASFCNQWKVLIEQPGQLLLNIR